MLREDQRVRYSKRLAKILRHDPAGAGIRLDAHGWADIDELMSALDSLAWSMSYLELEEVVTTSDKQRFAIDTATHRIRANQGHSVEVDLELTAELPPTLLFHGTVERFLPGIRERGLIRGGRHHVHLSVDRAGAELVGERRGDPVVLTVDGFGMAMDGLQFFRSANGVWLTDFVPVDRITFPTAPSKDFQSVVVW